MKMKHLLPLLLVGIALSGASATTVIPPTFDQLVKQADFIFQGTVTNSQSVWTGEGAQRHIETYVTFQVNENVKGEAGSSYTIRMLGGTVGDETFEITDTPKFKIGDRDILFVEHNNEQFVPLVGISYGRFHVQRDEQAGRDVLLTNEGEAVRDLTQLGRNQAAATVADVSQAITPDALKSAIHQQLGDSPASPTR